MFDDCLMATLIAMDIKGTYGVVAHALLPSPSCCANHRERLTMDRREEPMNDIRFIVALPLAAATLAVLADTAAADAKYPDLKGQWERVGPPNWTPAGKPPFTSEYQAVYEANRADMVNGGAGGVVSQYCFPQGMPMMMNMYDPMEIVVTPDVTYILISHVNDSYRRIYTDGREWPDEDEFVPTHIGYSIGKWVDQDGDGTYDALEVETRHLLSDRVYDASGLPFHKDGKTVIKERISLDKADKNVLRDEITVYDNALTQPWSIVKTAKRNLKARPLWRTAVCAESNTRVKIEDENYFLSFDGKLMPTRKDQPPPDLRYFTPRR
jgi:hypothetical protein